MPQWSGSSMCHGCTKLIAGLTALPPTIAVIMLKKKPNHQIHQIPYARVRVCTHACMQACYMLIVIDCMYFQCVGDLLNWPKPPNMRRWRHLQNHQNLEDFGQVSAGGEESICPRGGRRIHHQRMQKSDILQDARHVARGVAWSVEISWVDWDL